MVLDDDIANEHRRIESDCRPLLSRWTAQQAGQILSKQNHSDREAFCARAFRAVSVRVGKAVVGSALPSPNRTVEAKLS